MLNSREASDAAWAAHDKPKPNGAHDYRFRLVRFGVIELDDSRPYLIKGLLPREGLAVVWGAPKCGKTFWTFDLAMHVALGRDYRERRVEAGTVVYIACKGERGLAARATAFRQAKIRDDADPPFFLLTTALDLVADADPLMADISAQIPPDPPCRLIVVDTLNRSIGGSGSDDRDMTAYIRAADALRTRFKCTVLIIHHCGIDATRPRGHTALAGAVDAQISIKRDGRDQVLATVERMKDGPEGDQIVSRLLVVEVGFDVDGEPITSCVVEAAEGPANLGLPKKLPDAAKIALDTLRKAVSEVGSLAPGSNHIPPTARTVEIETWRRYYYAGTATDGQAADARKKAFQRVRQQLQAAGVIGLHTENCWVVADV